MIQHKPYPASLKSLFHSFWQNRSLIKKMGVQEISSRYRGSLIGLAWTFVHPLFMLAVYTFVFTFVFQARWAAVNDGNAQFSIILFAGLITHALFAETIVRAPGVILANTNFVKKVVFPLEILPIIITGTALVQALVSFGILVLALFFLDGYVSWTLVFLPIVVIPFFVLTVGVAFLLAALGTFIRDIGQTVGILATVLLFMSPVFYPMSSLPDRVQSLLLLNPLTFIIEQVRQVTIFGGVPNMFGLAVYLILGLIFLQLGYYVFQKTRKGFADVL